MRVCIIGNQRSDYSIQWKIVQQSAHLITIQSIIVRNYLIKSLKIYKRSTQFAFYVKITHIFNILLEPIGIYCKWLSECSNCWMACTAWMVESMDAWMHECMNGCQLDAHVAGLPGIDRLIVIIVIWMSQAEERRISLRYAGDRSKRFLIKTL